MEALVQEDRLEHWCARDQGRCKGSDVDDVLVA